MNFVGNQRTARSSPKEGFFFGFGFCFTRGLLLELFSLLPARIAAFIVAEQSVVSSLSHDAVPTASSSNTHQQVAAGIAHILLLLRGGFRGCCTNTTQTRGLTEATLQKRKSLQIHIPPGTTPGGGPGGAARGARE